MSIPDTFYDRIRTPCSSNDQRVERPSHTLPTLHRRVTRRNLQQIWPNRRETKCSIQNVRRLERERHKQQTFVTNKSTRRLCRKAKRDAERPNQATARATATPTRIRWLRLHLQGGQAAANKHTCVAMFAARMSSMNNIFYEKLTRAMPNSQRECRQPKTTLSTR